jgi:AP endonuclease 2
VSDFCAMIVAVYRSGYAGWNTKIQARETNYGTRVDYILVTPGLMKWIKHGDIQPSLKGSDHCPIYIDLHDEITLHSGETVTLRDAMQQSTASKDLPRIAAKYWEEYSAKQTKLSTFFSKKSELRDIVTLAPAGTSSAFPSSCTDSSDAPISQGTHRRSDIPKKPSVLPKPQTKKRANADSLPTSSNKKLKKDPGQATIGSFFQKPKAASSVACRAGSSSTEPIEVEDAPADQPSTALTSDNLDQLEADYRLACELAGMTDDMTEQSLTSTPPTPTSSQSKTAWSNLFASVPAPKCIVHGEPTKKLVVNKAGPNKGRGFYVCSRYVLSSHDLLKGILVYSLSF